jgi:hypothetical protein
MKKLLLSSIAAIALISGFANAEDKQSVGVNLGSIGAEVDYTRMIMPEYNLALRVGLGGFSYSGDYDDTDTHYDTDLSQFNLGATLEYHPFASGFYIGAGIYYQNPNYEMEATPSGGEYEFNGNTYPAELVGSVNGTVEDINKVVPYIGIGYDASLFDSGNLFFTFKAGAWYQDSPTVSLTAHDCALDDIRAGSCDQLRYDLDQEEDDINEDIKDYQWWPVVQIGISYRF